MVDASEAVHIAEESLSKVVPKFAALKPQVEELELSRDGDLWIVTFRAENPHPEAGSDQRGFSQTFFPYIEKVVRIAAHSGDLLSVLNPSYGS